MRSGLTVAKVRRDVLTLVALILTGGAPLLHADDFTTLRDRYISEDAAETEKLQREADEAIASSDKVAALFRKINEVPPGAKSNSQRDAITKTISERYPGALIVVYAHYKGPSNLPTNPKAIEQELRSWLETFLAQASAKNTATCVSADPRSYSGSAPCRERLAQECVNFSSDGRGGLQVSVIDDALRVRDLSFESEEQLGAIYPNAAVTGKVDFCRLAAVAGARFQSSYPVDWPLTPKGTGFPFMSPYPESVKADCLGIDFDDLEGRFADLETRFSGIWAEYHVGEWRKDLKVYRAGCLKAVKELCQNTYVVAEKVILDYPTKGCEVREVTAEDIDADIKNMNEAGLTKADQLNHAQLKEQILACQAAHEKGYSWKFVEPSTKNCKKAKKK
jgi:hypothetical protein